MTSHDDATSDAHDLAVLNAYLEELQAGRTPDRQALAARHPHLTRTLDFLIALDSLVPHCDAQSGAAPSPLSAPTIAADGNAPDPIASPVPPSLGFGDYEIEQEIGRGGMGVIYRARQKSLDRVVAIKMILASHLASRDQVERFQAEARAAAKLRHPNIVDIHEAGQTNGQHYIVMEYVDGPSLADLLARGPMEPEVAATHLAAIARAVEHLHQHGIVHRDLKPSNILFDGAGEPHVTDFGLAKTLESEANLTVSGAVVGTPSYMAPEQAAGRTREVGPPADIYALGAILYCMLTGEPPFHAETPLDTLVQVLEREPRLPSQIRSNVPRDLELICLRCLEKTAESRYVSAQAVAEDLERFLRGDVVEARPPNLLTQIRRWSRREPALTSRLGLLALCGAIELANYVAGTRSLAYLLRMLTIFMIWATASLFFQRALASDRWAQAARFAWAAADALLVTAVIVLADALETPLVVVYPAIVAASGLWFSVRLVYFVTALSIVSYTSLVAYWHFLGNGLGEPLYRHLITLIVLVVLGAVIAYQVKRVRALSRFYERRL